MGITRIKDEMYGTGGPPRSISDTLWERGNTTPSQKEEDYGQQ